MRGAVVALVVLVSLAGVASGAGNQPPLVDAGLDQRVELGETVLVDALGSSDPDGSIESYAWQIETPSGATRAPACAECAWTRFTPVAVGTYTVTLTVTDDGAARRSDHLFVTVRPAPGPPTPAGSARGPAEGGAGTPRPAGAPGSGSSGEPPEPPATPGGVAASDSWPSVEVYDIRRVTWLGRPEEPESSGSVDITTYPEVSPFGTSVGGVTYFRESNGETRNSNEALLEVIERTD